MKFLSISLLTSLALFCNLPAQADTSIRIASGATGYLYPSGNVWAPDTGFVGSYGTYTTAQTIANTPDPTLYQAERYGNMRYSFSVPNGSYMVTLKFAEIYFNAVNLRAFNVTINDQQVLSSFDVFAAAGGSFKAIDKSFPVTVTNGTIGIVFSSVLDNPKIDAIEIDQEGVTGSPTTNPPSPVPPALLPAPPTPPTPAPTPTSAVQAISANQFLGSLGVGTHISQGYDSNTYVAPINYLGIRNIRDGANNLYSTYLLHQKTGVLADLSLDCSQVEYNTNNALPFIVQYVSSKGALLSLEGPNEPNNWPVTYNGAKGGGSGTWVPVAQCQRDLYSQVKANSALSQYPVFATTLGGGETDNAGLQFLTIPSGAGALLPDGTQFADYANVHNYVSSNDSTLHEDNQAWMAADTQQNAFPGDTLFGEFGSTFFKHYAGYSPSQLQSLPRVTTETGWDSVGNLGGEPLQGRMLTNTYLAQFKRGWAYTFIYELVDNEGGNSTQGLFHSDYTPKLAATYIHNLTLVLADTGMLAAPGTLNYSIANQPATVHDLLLQKSNGTFELVIWDERASASDQVTVSLGVSFSSVNVYDVTAGTSPVQTLDNVQSVPLTLSDHAVILELR